MKTIQKCFGERLKVLRKINNFTQEKLAELIGINLRQLARIESGESFITADTLYNICRVLAISPKLLFDFEVYDETLMTGSGNKVHFEVIKNGNLISLINKSQNFELNSDNYDNPEFDNKMLKIAHNTQKEIIVEEFRNGTSYQTKIYKPDGSIEITAKNNEDENFRALLDNINTIKNDKNKIEYLNLAYKSLNDKDSLNKLKTMIKGIELTK